MSEVDFLLAPLGADDIGVAQRTRRCGVAFDDLDAPIRRLTGVQTPVPYSPSLESAIVPNAAKIAQAIRDLVAE